KTYDLSFLELTIARHTSYVNMPKNFREILINLGISFCAIFTLWIQNTLDSALKSPGILLCSFPDAGHKKLSIQSPASIPTGVYQRFFCALHKFFPAL